MAYFLNDLHKHMYRYRDTQKCVAYGYYYEKSNRSKHYNIVLTVFCGALIILSAADSASVSYDPLC